MSSGGSKKKSSIEIILAVGLEGSITWAGNGLVPVFWEIGGEIAKVPLKIKSWTLCLRARVMSRIIHMICTTSIPVIILR